MPKFFIEEYEVIDVDVLRANRDHIYAVELTLDGQVCTGAACVLAEPNICGIPVRKAIVQDKHVPFSDQEIERVALIQALRKLYRMAYGRRLRMPQSGIGAGLCGLAVNSPFIYRELCQILADHFDYRQISQTSANALTPSVSNEAVHLELFNEVCTRGGYYFASFVAEKYGFTLDQLKAHCVVAGRELEAKGKLYPFHLPTFRWASGQ